MTTMILEATFWVAFFLLVYVYAIYPLAIALFAYLAPYHKLTHNPQPKLIAEPFEPPVSIIIAAYNEERHIAAKIENTLALDYPSEKVEIIVGSDGSTDQTNAIVMGYAAQGVRLAAFADNRGKTTVQNDCVRQARSAIIVFMDASSLCETGALKKLVAPFADPGVGCVAGQIVFVQSRENLTTESQGLYWKYEQMLKRAEGRIGSLVGVDGPLYALRKERYVVLGPDIISDLITPLLVIRDGYAVVYEPGAITYEEATTRPQQELRTRRRIVTRGLAGLLQYPELFNFARRPLIACQIVSHKLLRWFAGFYFILMLISALVLIGRPVYFLAFFGLALLLVFAWIGLRTQDHPRTVFAVPYYFILVNWAALLGALDYLRGKQVVSWKPVRH